jgi:hypothetical protein
MLIRFLPTYASRLNPIEKLWRWLKQQVLHLHPLADNLAHLRDQVCEFLNQFAVDSDVLLRYVGLLPNQFAKVQKLALQSRFTAENW